LLDVLWVGTAFYLLSGLRPQADSRRAPDRQRRVEGGAIMAKGFFMVRSEVPNAADRAAFDHWYDTDHLPWAVKDFGALRAWRCWSRTDPAIHYAFYEFADVEAAEAVAKSEIIKKLVADFDRVWGERVPRRREILQLVQEFVPG
jgi:hypothetical protein